MTDHFKKMLVDAWEREKQALLDRGRIDDAYEWGFHSGWQASQAARDAAVGRYILDLADCSGPAIKTFDQFLTLVRHGAKFIDIRVRKDGQEYEFQADILKYVRKETR